MKPVVVAPVIVTAVLDRAVTTEDAGPSVLTMAGVFVKGVGNV